jgi:hypothetical protein
VPYWITGACGWSRIKNRRYQIATNLTAKVNKLGQTWGRFAQRSRTCLVRDQPRSGMLSHMSPADLVVSQGVSASGSSHCFRQGGGFQNRLLQSQALSHLQMGAGSGYVSQPSSTTTGCVNMHLIADAQAVGTIQGSVIGRYAASRQDMGFNAYVWCLGARAGDLQTTRGMAALQYWRVLDL